MDERDTNDLVESFGEILIEALAHVSRLAYLSDALSQRGAALPQETCKRLAGMLDACQRVEEIGSELCEDEALQDALDAAEEAH